MSTGRVVLNARIYEKYEFKTLLFYTTSHPSGQKTGKKWLEFFLDQTDYEFEYGRQVIESPCYNSLLTKDLVIYELYDPGGHLINFFFFPHFVIFYNSG